MANDRFTKAADAGGEAATPSVPAKQEAPSAFREVQMRRWPHPIPPRQEEGPVGPSLHYIHCALAYQNQTLADIKALLQKLTQEEGLFDGK